MNTNGEEPHAAVRLQAVTKTYAGPPPVEAVVEASMTIRPGEWVALVGPSGSGKSTVLHLMGALERPTSGSIEVAGQPVHGLDDRALARLRSHHLGFVFQHFALLPHLSAIENLQTALLYQGVDHPRRPTLARAALDSVGLAARADHRPAQLSGGEQQRVAIARAVVGRPTIVLADEPTGNLDRAAGRAVLEILGELNRAGTTVAMITHDREVAAAATRQVEIVDGRIRS